MGASDGMLQLVCSVLVFSIPAALLIALPPIRRAQVLAAIIASAVGLFASLGVDALASTPSDGAGGALDAAYAGAIAGAVAVLAAHRLGGVGGAVFGSVWTILVFQPVFAALVGSVPSIVQTVFGAVDYAAVLATHVAAAASLLALHLLPVSPRSAAQVPQSIALGRATVAMTLLIIGASSWMLGVERVINDASGRIVLNAVVGMLLGAVTWMLIARFAAARFAPAGLVAGAMLGWAAVGSGVAFLSPVALAATAIIGTASGAAVVLRSQAPGAARACRASIAVIVAVAVGGLVLALLADGFGLAATGTAALVIGQLGAVAAITLGSFASGLICWAFAVAAVVLSERRQLAVRH